MRRPLKKPAIRKLEILEVTRCYEQKRLQWFVLTPGWDGTSATAVPSFKAGLELLPVLGR